MNQNNIFDCLFEIIKERKESPPAKSYVASLMQSGVGKINAKIREEAQEVCEAALENDEKHLVHEMCDLLFHLFVLAGFKDLSLSQLENELKRRFGISGLEEKARRKENEPK